MSASLFIEGPGADRPQVTDALGGAHLTVEARGPRGRAASSAAPGPRLGGFEACRGAASLWAAADNLRFGSSGNAVAILSALNRARLL